MSKAEAIKYLQQLYPNGGHCWLDEQRIEAISMAISALEYKCTEEPVSEDLDEAATTFADVHVYATRMVCFKAGANWQKQQMMKNAVNTEVCHIFGDEDKAFFPMYGMDMKQGDKVKLIIIKEE